MATIRVEHLTKRFGRQEALSNVSFEAKSGTLTVLLGPSGCGKSTLLRMVAGLEEPTEGSIFIDGRDVTALPPAARKISMVFQSYALFPHLSVAENILFGMKVRRADRKTQKAGLDRVADLLGLAPLLDRKPSQLSGGQQQRVAVGRAIVADAPICLMDEPMSNLDAQLRNEMRVEIHALQRKLKITMLYVTHDQVEAMSMADQIILLNAGRIEQIASPVDLYAKPRTVFSARFVGTPPMNVFPASKPVLERAGASLPSGVPAQPDLLVGLRPEEIRIVERGVPAAVRDVEYLGADVIVHCVLDGHPVLVRQGRDAPPQRGGSVCLAWDAEDIHFFDASSGQVARTRSESLQPQN